MNTEDDWQYSLDEIIVIMEGNGTTGMTRTRVRRTAADYPYLSPLDCRLAPDA